MLGAVVQQMASLAERLDVAMPAPAMRGVVVEMSGRQHDLGRRPRCCWVGAGQGISRPRPSRQVWLSGPIVIITEMAHHLAMRPPA